MGNEDPWFVIGLGAVALLVIAIAIFIPAKFDQLFFPRLATPKETLRAANA
jgi:hypothetical protein